jgi:mandelate racemase
MTTAPTVRSIRARPVQVPFKRPPLSASGALPSAALVLVDLETREGLTGRSYLFAFAPWALEPLVGCVEAMSDILTGGAVAPFAIETRLASSSRCSTRPGWSVSRWPAWTCARGMSWRRRRVSRW